LENFFLAGRLQIGHSSLAPDTVGVALTVLWAALTVGYTAAGDLNSEFVTTRNALMATTEIVDCLKQIGETAGDVWHCLKENGPLSNAKLAKEIDAPRDMVMQAVGWLAREGKVTIIEKNRGKTVQLVTPAS
jgi:hypothetical protein